MKFAPVCLLALAAGFASAQYAGSAPIPVEYRPGVAAITHAEAQKYLTFLATQCEGRGTGQPGYQKAAEFVAEHFKEAGLKPVGDNGTYFQNISFYRAAVDSGASWIGTDDGKLKITGPKSISWGRLGADADKTAPVIFLRANGHTAKLDSADALDGKIVILAIANEADPNAKPGERGANRNRELRSQVNLANTVAVITVSDELPTPSGRLSQRQGAGSTSLNGLVITTAEGQKLATALGANPTVLDASGEESGKAEVAYGNAQLHIVAKAKQEEVKVPNVVGLLEGSDPTLKAQIVGIGAHLDHLGKNGDVVYPGADDDGSGSTALWLVAKALRDGGIKPKRSILFMNFCGEEMGLLGSGYYSDHPIFPHDRMVAELQMDMVGRDSEGVQNGDAKRVDKKEENIDTIRLVGSKRISTELNNIIEANNKYIGFKFKWDAEDVYTRSDHYNFAKHGIPIAFLFDGFHPDYHQPTDTVDKIDWAKLTNSAKLYYIVALDLANRAEAPKHDVPQGGGGGR